MSTTTYHATTWREEGFWVVEVSELDIMTQARRLDQVEAMTRDLIAVWLDVPADSFSITVEHQLPGDVADEIAQARKLRAEADAKAAEAAHLWADSAYRLHELGLSLRDIGKVLDVSFQRAKQLVDEARLVKP